MVLLFKLKKTYTIVNKQANQIIYKCKKLIVYFCSTQKTNHGIDKRFCFKL